MTLDASTPPIVLVHGLWLTPRGRDGWKQRFESRGHRVLAPAWPRVPGEVEDVRRDPSALVGLGVAEIADHYGALVCDLDPAPIVIGHSFGGLVTELLLDRGLGAAGVALSPAPLKRVLRLPPAQLRAAFPVLDNPANRHRTVELTAKQFHYVFTNTMEAGDARAAFDRYQIPGPGRPIFQAPFANFSPGAPTKADFHKDDRAPLLIVGNGADHTVPASVSQGRRQAPRQVARSNRLQGVSRAAALHRWRSGVGGGGRLRTRLGDAPGRRGGRAERAPHRLRRGAVHGR